MVSKEIFDLVSENHSEWLAWCFMALPFVHLAIVIGFFLFNLIHLKKRYPLCAAAWFAWKEVYIGVHIYCAFSVIYFGTFGVLFLGLDYIFLIIQGIKTIIQLHDGIIRDCIKYICLLLLCITIIIVFLLLSILKS